MGIINNIVNTWLRLVKGRKGDLVAFYERKLVVFSRLPSAVKEGDWVQTQSLVPMKHGKGFICHLRVADIGVPAWGHGSTKEEAVRNWVTREVRLRKLQGEQHAQRLKEMEAQRQLEAELDTIAVQKVVAKLSRQERLLEALGSEQLVAVYLQVVGWDFYSENSDDHRLVLAGRQQRAAAIAAWQSLNSEQRAALRINLPSSTSEKVKHLDMLLEQFGKSVEEKAQELVATREDYVAHACEVLSHGLRKDWAESSIEALQAGEIDKLSASARKLLEDHRLLAQLA